MRNTIKILILSIFILIILSLATSVNAASANISASKTSATVGENVTVTVNINAAAWSVSVIGDASGRITGYNDDGVNQQVSKQYTINTSTAGTYTVSIMGDVTDQSSDYSTPVSGSVTITVTNPPAQQQPETPSNNGGTTQPSNNTTKPNNNTTTKPTETKSNNSKLSSLKIAEGAITPEFDNKVREYTVNIPNEITKLSIEAVADDLKATTKITGNEELQVGENLIEIVVTAEDGSRTTYKITAIRADEELGLQSLNIFYIDENGEKVSLDLDPIFGAGIVEYTLKDISYKIDKLLVEAIANKEIAIVDIAGHEGLKEGKNEIKITVTIKHEQEEGQEEQDVQEEQKVYTIIVNKETAPAPAAPLTTTQKIKNWFSGAGTWISENSMKIQAVALIVATTALAGLTLYFVYDYKNYKNLVEKLAEINKTNLMEKANVALSTESIPKTEITENSEETANTTEEPSKKELIEEFVKNAETSEEKWNTKSGKGRRFR